MLEALLEYERAGGGSPEVTEARLRGQEYLLERRLFRRRSTGEVIERDRKGDAAWTRFAFPTWWHYDVLRGLEYLRRAGVAPDERVAEAIDLVASKRDGDGRWPLETQLPRHDAGRDGRGRGPAEPVEHAARLTRVGLVFSTRLNGVPSPSRPGSYCRTLTELAERVGVSIVNLSVLKNNRAKVVRFSTLTAICEVLDCEVGDVLGLRP